MKITNKSGENWVTLELDGEALTAELLTKATETATSCSWAWNLFLSLSLDQFATTKELLASNGFVVSGTETRNVNRTSATFMNLRKSIRRSGEGLPRSVPADVRVIQRPGASGQQP